MSKNIGSSVAQHAVWYPQYPSRELTGEAIKRAEQLQRALTPTLARIDDPVLTRAGFERLGVEDYRETFGHGVSTRHWRRLFRRTLDRDRGAKNWARLEIYLEENPARRPEFRRRSLYVPVSLQPLRELIASFENPASPKQLEKDCLWIYAFEDFEREVERGAEARSAKRALVEFLSEHAPFLGRSGRGIRIQFERKFRRWTLGGRVPAAIADRRKQNPGRPSPKLSKEEEHALIAKSLRCGGGVAQAWRESREKGNIQQPPGSALHRQPRQQIVRPNTH